MPLTLKFKPNRAMARLPTFRSIYMHANVQIIEYLSGLIKDDLCVEQEQMKKKTEHNIMEFERAEENTLFKIIFTSRVKTPGKLLAARH